MTTGGKIVTGLVVGGGIYLAVSSSSSASPGKRKPYRIKIPTVPNDIPWSTVDEAICQCFQAGEQESVALVSCTLKRIWPEVPWPHRPGDHLSVLRVWQAVGARVATFIALPEDQRAAACAEVPPPKDEPPPAEDVVIGDWFKDEPGHFARVTQTGNNNPSRTVQRIYGFATTNANNGRVVVCNANSGFNLLFYSRKANAGTFGSASVVTASGDRHNYDIGPAWLPWNDRVETAALQGSKLARKIGWNGTGPVTGSAKAFGSPWMVPITMTQGGIAICTNADPWAAENNPPAEVLAKLGWSLAEMKAAWLAGNP